MRHRFAIFRFYLGEPSGEPIRWFEESDISTPHEAVAAHADRELEFGAREPRSYFLKNYVAVEFAPVYKNPSSRKKPARNRTAR